MRDPQDAAAAQARLPELPRRAEGWRPTPCLPQHPAQADEIDVLARFGSGSFERQREVTPRAATLSSWPKACQGAGNEGKGGSRPVTGAGRFKAF